MSPSGAALSAVHALGLKWTAVSGSDFRTHDGVKLSALAARIDEKYREPAYK